MVGTSHEIFFVVRRFWRSNHLIPNNVPFVFDPPLSNSLGVGAPDRSYCSFANRTIQFLQKILSSCSHTVVTGLLTYLSTNTGTVLLVRSPFSPSVANAGGFLYLTVCFNYCLWWYCRRKRTSWVRKTVPQLQVSLKSHLTPFQTTRLVLFYAHVRMCCL